MCLDIAVLYLGVTELAYVGFVAFSVLWVSASWRLLLTSDWGCNGVINHEVGFCPLIRLSAGYMHCG